MDMRMRVHNNNHLLKHLSAHDEVDTCSIGVVSPEQPVLSNPIRPTTLTVLTITQRNISETRPRGGQVGKAP